MDATQQVSLKIHKREIHLWYTSHVMILGLNSLAEFGGEGLREKFQSSELVVRPPPKSCPNT